MPFSKEMILGASGNQGAAGFYEYQIEQSCRFDKADDSTLKFDVTSAGDRTSWAFSTWLKHGLLNTSDSGDNGSSTIFGSGRSGQYDYIGFFDIDMHITWQDYLGASTPPYGKTNQKFRDVSAWYHLVWVWDSDDSTQADRSRIYVNGTRITNYSNSRAVNSGDQTDINNSGRDFVIGDRAVGDGKLFDGYLANVFFIDGQKKVASDFGQVDTSTNRWIPKAYTGTFGNNGYKLAFGTAPGTGSGAGTDTSGEGHNWTENNFTASDQMIDTPTKNFTTFDPGYSGGGSNVWTEGNTKVKGTDGSLSDSSTTTF